MSTFTGRNFAEPLCIQGAKKFLSGTVLPFHGETALVTSPMVDHDANEKIVIGQLAQMSQQDSVGAVQSASSAWNNGQGEWPQMAAADRIAIFRNIITSLKERREEIIQLLIWEICKTTKDATTEFDRTMEFMEATIVAYEALLASGCEFKSIGGVYSKVRRSAIGVLLCLGPYNYPFNETYATLIPALLVGNVAILKLPTIGGLAHMLTIDTYAKHLPNGVLNFVSGLGRVTVDPMMKSGLVDMFAFIGSSKAADTIIKEHPFPHRLTVYLGLEAKNVAVVMPDADMNATLTEVLLGSLSFNGQRCTAIKLTMVHSSIADEFVSKLKQKVNELKCGLPWEEGVAITPLPDGAKKVEYLRGLLIDADNKGAKTINFDEGGGNVISSQKTKYTSASLFKPAVVYPVTSDMRLWQEEQFGPIVPVAVYSDVSQVIEYFRTSHYGQQAAIFTKDADSAAPLVDILSTTVGRININTQCSRGPDVLPFSGRRSSSLGTLSINEGLTMFSIATVIAGKDNEANRSVLDKLKNNSKFLK